MVRDPPAPVPPATDLPLLQLIARLQSNPLAAWPRQAYEEMFLHRRYLGTDTYLVNDPDEARRIFLLDVESYERPLAYRRLYRPIFGRGLLLAEGAEWREQRRRLAPAFNPRQIEALIPCFLAVGERLVGRLQGAGRANLSRLFQDAAIDAVGAAALATPLDALAQRIRTCRTNYFHRAAKVSIFDHFARREEDFFLHGGERGRHGRTGRSIVREIIQQRRSRPTKDAGSRDVIGLLLEAQRNGCPAVTEEHLCDEVATILGTGFDTTGRAMFWTAYLLALHPESQDRVRTELRRFPPSSARRLSDFEHWPYLRQCIWESMRLYPPLQGVLRSPRSPMEICGHTVPAGSYVAVSAWVMHRHRALWDRPDAFLPERFAGEAGEAARVRGFIPFGLGKRTCLGAAFATTEITLVLAQLLGRYSIELADHRPIEPRSVVTTRPTVEPMFRLQATAMARAEV